MIYHPLMYEIHTSDVIDLDNCLKVAEVNKNYTSNMCSLCSVRSEWV
jgi:hypothetical protein